jgi:hypothetical protein
MPNMAAVVRIEDGEAATLADTWAFERENNPDGFILEAHPYGMTAGPDGMLWVADAGANTLYKVDPDSGEITLVAAFDGLPGPMPNPARNGANESDPVPTGVTVGDDGTAYVSFLPGFPFTPGSAKVVQVSPAGEISDFATGLTMITDLRAGPDGNLYAVTLAVFGEQGPTPNSGAITRISETGVTEEVLSGLSFPSSIDFSANGDAYVTLNAVGAPGSGEVRRFADLAQSDAVAAGEPQTGSASGAEEAAAEQPGRLPSTGSALPFEVWGTWLALVAIAALITVPLIVARRLAVRRARK